MPIKKKTGFCLGRFDVLHGGHIALFKTAKRHCDVLVVGVMADAFKGLERSKVIFPIKERMAILRALRDVDSVVGFRTEQGVKQWLKRYKPDMLITGAAYRKHQPLRDYFRQIVYTDVRGSSTAIKHKIARSVDRKK